jgi:hypothetical protein
LIHKHIQLITKGKYIYMKNNITVKAAILVALLTVAGTSQAAIAIAAAGAHASSAATAKGVAKSSSNNTGNNYNSSNATNINNPASTAYAPSVQVGGADMCRSGVGAGGQGSAFGISFGGTVVDQNCERLKLAREIAVVLGDKQTAKELLCQDPRVAKAYASAGKPCSTLVTHSGGVAGGNTRTLLGTVK